MDNTENPILYVVVVGFHHKKGCQVEYSFPPLVPDSPNECPPGWKYLPTLALPDGSHNFDEDTVYFHLPSLTNPKHTVFGISCFRQIPIDRIKNRTADMTRGTVQKSVCVLSKIPLYGQIQVKMSLITHAYFDEGDFSKVSILEDTYHHLNSVLMQNEFQQQMFVGLSTRDFILTWKHKALLLFKLLLLEKRVMFFKSPVNPLSSTILTLVSLFPDMIEKGLNQSSSIRLSRPMSPMPEFSDDDSSQHSTPTKNPDVTRIIENIDSTNQNVTIAPPSQPELIGNGDAKNLSDIPLVDLQNLQLMNGKEILEHYAEDLETRKSNAKREITEVGIELTEQEQKNNEISINGTNNEKSNSLQRDVSSDAITADVVHQNNMNYLSHLSTVSCGFPLTIFTKGYLCLPYLSLPYLDLLTDMNVRGYIVGATNVLFKQKTQLYDVLVDIENGRIECQDVELRKQLHLTTEDLRFADYVVKHVSDERHDVFLDGVGWEGGDEWIRTQFRIYLLCLLRTSLLQDGSREIEHFNSSFVTAWRETHNYKMWLSGIHPGILDVNPGHPFAGQLSVADMKLRLAHTMQNTDGGRRINQAMLSTGRAVATTSKAVGGAFTQARGAFSSWWSNLLVSPEPSVQKAVEALPDGEVSSSEEAQVDESTIDHNNSASPNNAALANENMKNKENNMVNGNVENSIDVQDSTTRCELHDSKVPLDKDSNNHQPGAIHTV